MNNSCSQCETPLPRDSQFCPRCGTPVPGVETSELLASSASDPTGLLDRVRSATEGDFTIIREIGRGGMGRVLLAHEIALDRRVAMKVLPLARTELTVPRVRGLPQPGSSTRYLPVSRNSPQSLFPF